MRASKQASNQASERAGGREGGRAEGQPVAAVLLCRMLNALIETCVWLAILLYKSHLSPLYNYTVPEVRDERNQNRP